MNTRATLALTVSALLVGVLLGYFIPPLFTGEAEQPVEQTGGKASAKSPSKGKQPPGHIADLNRLRARIRDAV